MRRSTLTKQNKAVDKRSRIINEIQETEKAYVDKLFTVVDIFLAPLRDNQVVAISSSVSANTAESFPKHNLSVPVPAIEQRLIQYIFSNIEQVAQVNQELFEALTDAKLAARAKPANALIGKAFLDFAPYVKMYELYCSSYTHATSTIHDLQKNKSSLQEFFR